MEFYTEIGDFYDFIFPYNPAQQNFVQEVLNEVEGKKLLDIGCGTGSLTYNLSELGFEEVYAIDFDPKMVEKAKEKKEKHHKYPVFQEMDMREVSKNFKANSFDTITCFGNTLVHLPTLDDVEFFIQSVSEILKPNGNLMLQILNYDHILKNRINQLPLIENEKIRFDRNYIFREDNLIDFKTKLTIKATGQAIENNIPLNPIRKDELTSLLEKHHFSNIKLYGDFMMNPLKEDSLPLVLQATKKSRI